MQSASVPVSTPTPVEGGQPETTRRQKTRDRLIEAAFEVFAELGVHAASIETIVERAGFTRGAFYSNFDSKEQLFFSLAEHETADRLARVEKGIGELVVAGSLGTPTIDLRSLSSLVERLLIIQGDDSRWCLVQNEFRLLAMRDAAVAAPYLHYQHAFQQQLAHLLEESINRVGLRFTMDVLDVTRVMVTIYENAMQDAILSGAPDVDAAARSGALKILPALIIGLTEPTETLRW